MYNLPFLLTLFGISRFLPLHQLLLLNFLRLELGHFKYHTTLIPWCSMEKNAVKLFGGHLLFLQFRTYITKRTYVVSKIKLLHYRSLNHAHLGKRPPSSNSSWEMQIPQNVKKQNTLNNRPPKAWSGPATPYQYGCKSSTYCHCNWQTVNCIHTLYAVDPF